MRGFKLPVRKAILNQTAKYDLLVILLSFAVSVAITRLFLEITGYPQLGTGELHIAHVLWGGLLLFIAVLLLIIFANRWIHPISAAISGVGVGLFIDEVGKFITRDNDYFYPSAAPIIYVIFLLTVFVFLLVRKPRNLDQRTNLYYVLEDLQEVADHDLSESEKHRIKDRLETIIQQDPSSNLAELAHVLLKFLKRKELQISPHTPTLFERTKKRWAQFENKHLPQKALRHLLIIGLSAWGAFILIAPILILFLSNTSTQIERILASLLHDELLRNATGLNWFEARIGLEAAIGLFVCMSAVSWILGQEQFATITSSIVLILSLTVVNLLVFYFDQFSAIATSIPQFILLIGVLRYRQRFIETKIIA